MNQEKFGNFIKNIRKQNNLTQKDLADKYNVTYQAVSKWENGKNMPDMILIKKIANDFNISIEDMLNGEYSKNKKTNKFIYIMITAIILVICIVILLINLNTKDFEFKTLESSCDNFTISGSLAYNKNKTAIYITNINYCGGNDKKEYKKIECTLYESHDDILKKIDAKQSDETKTNLESFLEEVTFSIDNYSDVCKKYTENSFYLEINATDENDEITVYKVPLTFSNSCIK